MGLGLLQQQLLSAVVGRGTVPRGDHAQNRVCLDEEVGTLLLEEIAHSPLKNMLPNPAVIIDNEITVIRRFDQKPPVEAVPVRPSQSAAAAENKVNSSSSNGPSGVVESKQQERPLQSESSATVSRNADSLKGHALPKSPKRPPPPPLQEPTAPVDQRELKGSPNNQRLGQVNITMEPVDNAARGKEALKEREAVSFFVDVGPTGPPRHRPGSQPRKERVSREGDALRPSAVAAPAKEVRESEPSTVPDAPLMERAENAIARKPVVAVRTNPLFSAPPSSETKAVEVKQHISREREPEAKEMLAMALYRTDYPLRCVRVLSKYGNGEDGDTQLHVAVGSNSKSIYTMRFDAAAVLRRSHAADPARRGPVSAVDAVTMSGEFLNVHKGSVYALDWLESQQLLVSGSNDKYLKICK